MTHYYIDTPEGRIWYAGSIKLKDGGWVSNPTLGMMINEGWKSFEPEPPTLYVGNEPVNEDVSLKRLFDKHPESKNIVKLVSSGLVYHYTTWDVLFKGILSPENVAAGRAVLRAYSVNYMNDSLEGLIIPRGLSKAEDKQYEGKESEIVTSDGTKVRCPTTAHPFYKRRKEMEEYSAHSNK